MFCHSGSRDDRGKGYLPSSRSVFSSDLVAANSSKTPLASGDDPMSQYGDNCPAFHPVMVLQSKQGCHRSVQTKVALPLGVILYEAIY